MKEKIGMRDLTLPLKIAVIGGIFIFIYAMLIILSLIIVLPLI